MAKYQARVATGVVLEYESLSVLLKHLRKHHNAMIDHGNRIRTIMLEEGEYRSGDFTICVEHTAMAVH